MASIGANTLNFTDLGSQSPYEGGGPPSTPHSAAAGMDGDGNAALPAPNKSAFVELQQHGYVAGESPANKTRVISADQIKEEAKRWRERPPFSLGRNPTMLAFYVHFMTH